MKRFYTLVFIFINGFLFAQLPLKRDLFPKKSNQEVMYRHNGGEKTVLSNRATVFNNDFSNPNDWTMTNTSSPSQDWEIVTTLPSYLTALGFDSTINSTSGGNFGLIDSYGAGNGSQDANLTTSASFDCSGNPTVQVRFENYHKKYYDHQYVMASNDGVNFNTYEVNLIYGMTVGNFTTCVNTEEVYANISATASGQSTVWVRFNYVGNGDFFWAIDDISVEDIPANNLILTDAKVWNYNWSTIFGKRLDYYVVPLNQVDSLVIGGNLQNVGYATDTNAVLSFDVANSIPSIIANGGSSPINLPSGFDRFDSAIWSPASVVDDYSIVVFPSHNQIASNASTNTSTSRSYKIVSSSGWNSQYARDNDIPTAAGLWNGAGNGYIMGNIFQVYTNTMLYSIDVCFSQGTDPGVEVYLILYELDPNGSSAADILYPVIDQSLNGIEYTLQSCNISNNNSMDWQMLAVNSMNPLLGYPLIAGKQYLAAIGCYGGTENMVIQQGGESVDEYGSWIFDQTDATWYYMNIKPKIRMGMDQNAYWSNCSGVVELVNNKLSVYPNIPNPANETTTFDYFLESSAEVYFEVVDIAGKIIYSKELGKKGTGAYSLTLNTSDYAEGIYFYTMTADADKITKKMVIARN